MKYRNFRIALTEHLKKDGFIDSDVVTDVDTTYEKQFSEWCKIVAYFYKSDLAERVYLYCDVYFPNMEVEEKYKGFPLYRGDQHIYMLENYTKDNIENIMLDVNGYEKIFETEVALKKAVARNRKILKLCNPELIEFLGYKKINILRLKVFYVKKRN